MSERRAPAARREAVRGGQRAGQRRGKAVRRGRAADWLSSQFAQRPLPVWVLVAADVLVFAVALNVFALFHHVLPRSEQAVGIRSERMTATAEPQAAPPPTQDVAAAPTEAAPQDTGPDGYFGAKFADKFTAGEVERGEASYRSANISLTIEAHRYNDVDFYVMDFYLKDISSFRTAFAKDKFGRGEYESVEDTMARIGAIAGVNGDYYGGRSDGVVARNGTLYRDDDRLKRDLCVLYWNGEMETFSPAGFDAEAEMDAGAYQIWNFGPMLLDENGQAMSKFNSDVNPENPRTALGYFEPGHYCFVAVDGRSKKSEGLSLKSLSLLMQNLGCARAYNMDGGQTSKMVYGTSVVNVPAGGGRKSTDIIAIVEP